MAWTEPGSPRNHLEESCLRIAIATVDLVYPGNTLDSDGITGPTWAYVLQQLLLPLQYNNLKQTYVRVLENFIHLFLGLVPGYTHWFVLEHLLGSPSITSPLASGAHSSWKLIFSGRVCLTTLLQARVGRKHQSRGPAWMSRVS